MHHGSCLGQLSWSSLSLSDIDLLGAMLELSVAPLKASGGWWSHRSSHMCGFLSHYLFSSMAADLLSARLGSVSHWCAQCTCLGERGQAPSHQGPGLVGLVQGSCHHIWS